MEDILLNKDTDELDFINGDFNVGDSLTQEVSIVCRLTKGDLKSDPVLGPDLFLLKKSKVSNQDIESQIRLHLKRDNKDYDQIKQMIGINNI